MSAQLCRVGKIYPKESITQCNGNCDTVPGVFVDECLTCGSVDPVYQ